MISETLKKLISPPVDPSVKLTGVGMFLGKLLDRFDSRVTDLEARQLQKGDKGDRGEQGPAGKDGRDGKDGKDSTTPGPQGPKGDTGKVGPAGPKGVSVVDAEVAVDGNLVLKLSDGNIIDAGEIVQQVAKNSYFHSKQLANFQIVVSSTAPSNPSVNDLWYDTSA